MCFQHAATDLVSTHRNVAAMYLTLEIRFVSFSEIFLIAGPLIACTYIFRLLIKRAAFCVRHFATNVMYTICFGSFVFVYVFVVVYTKIELDTSHTQHARARARWIFSKLSSSIR